MCGRFSLATSKEKIQSEIPFVETANNLRLSYNIAPTQHANIVTNDSPERLQYVTWGLIPYWSKDGKNEGKLINARSEGIETKPSFRIPIRKRRCLILADSLGIISFVLSTKYNVKNDKFWPNITFLKKFTD